MLINAHGNYQRVNPKIKYRAAQQRARFLLPESNINVLENVLLILNHIEMATMSKFSCGGMYSNMVFTFFCYVLTGREKHGPDYYGIHNSCKWFIVME